MQSRLNQQCAISISVCNFEKSASCIYKKLQIYGFVMHVIRSCLSCVIVAQCNHGQVYVVRPHDRKTPHYNNHGICGDCMLCLILEQQQYQFSDSYLPLLYTVDGRKCNHINQDNELLDMINAVPTFTHIIKRQL